MNSSQTPKPSRPAKPRKPSRRRAAAKPDPAATTPDSSDADDSALQAFCSTIDLPEISFDSWERCLDHLDLRVPLWLPPADALAGGERLVSFARTSRKDPESPPARAPTSCVIQVPPGAHDGQQLTVKGQGDETAGHRGDLIVTVHLKSR